MVEPHVGGGAGGLDGRKNSERPDSLRSRTVGMVMPPAGPKVADLRVESMCGDEVECLSARLCRIGGIERVGDEGTSSTVTGLLCRSCELVFRLSWLGLRFIAGIVGLMKTGDDGSETSLDDREFVKGGCIESPFMFRGRLGPGEVMGRCVGSETVRDAIDGRPPKVGPGKEDSGMRLFMGDSGEEEGD